MRGLFTTVVSVMFGVAGVSAQTPPKWLLVRSNAEKLGDFTWERLAKAYLQKDFLVVRASKGATHPAASRLVIGTPNDNALVRTLAAELGVKFVSKHISYKGQRYPDGVGLAIVTDDPDGQGTLALFTGATARGALCCISVSVDLAKHGFVAMSWQKVLLRGNVSSNKPLHVDGAQLHVVRLDQELWRMQDRLAASSIDEAALRVSRAFAGYRFLFQRAVNPDIDLFEFTRKQFREHKAVLLATRKRFAAVDLDALVREQEAKVSKALGGRRGPKPVVYMIVTHAAGTNAQVIGADRKTGRIRMTINLAAFDSVAALRLAIAHEFVHTLQKAHGGTLLGRSLHEGVAVYISQRLYPDTENHEALMWSPQKLAAANKHRKAILEVFKSRRDLNDMRRIGTFLYAGSRLRAVLGAPDRCGYWIGWIAVRAWRAQNPQRPLADLLTVSPEKLYLALLN